MTFAAHHSAILLPGRLRPHSASGWADGYSGAPRGSPQHPALLDGYGPHRPPWNVAGVDYCTGIPQGAVLTDWRNLNDPNLNLNQANIGIIKFNGDYTFNNVDFSMGIGAVIYNQPNPGTASNITFNNCYFALPPFGSQQYGASASIVDQGPANITVRNCIFDGANMPNMTDFINTLGSANIQYNWFINSGEQIISLNSTTVAVTLVYKYNLVDNGHQEPGAHMNWLQWVVSGQTVVASAIMFNTCYQYTVAPSAAPGEGFQFYTNGSGFTMTNPAFTNNTMIAKPVPSNSINLTNSVSAMVHGSDPGTTSGGQNNNNYFDQSGAAFAFYPGTMVPSRGWSSSGNIDMNTGAVLTPA